VYVYVGACVRMLVWNCECTCVVICVIDAALIACIIHLFHILTELTELMCE